MALHYYKRAEDYALWLWEEYPYAVFIGAALLIFFSTFLGILGIVCFCAGPCGWCGFEGG